MLSTAFKLFLMAPCYQLFVWVFHLWFLSFVSTISSACDPFFIIFYFLGFQWLHPLLNLPESLQSLLKHINWRSSCFVRGSYQPVLVSFLFSSHLPSDASHLCGPASSWLLFIMFWVTSQLVPSLKNPAQLCFVVKYCKLVYTTYTDRVWDRGRALEQVCPTPILDQLQHRLSAREVPAIFWHCCLVPWKHLASWLTMRVLHWVKTYDSFWKACSEFWVTALFFIEAPLMIFLFLSRGICTFYTLLEIFLLFYFRAVLTFKFMQLVWLNLSLSTVELTAEWEEQF